MQPFKREPFQNAGSCMMAFLLAGPKGLTSVLTSLYKVRHARVMVK